METLSSADASVCASCARRFARYTCPRCRARTCSLACYRGHADGACRTKFEADALSCAMQGVASDAAARGEMARILLRQRGVSVRDEDHEGRSEPDEARTDDADVVRRLAEQAHVEPWQPWWNARDAPRWRLRARGTSVVEEEEEEDEDDDGWNDVDGHGGQAPHPPKRSLPQLHAMRSGPCADELRWHVADACFGYCATMRQHNGEWEADPRSAMDVAMQCSSVWEAARRRTKDPRDLPASAYEMAASCSARGARHIARGAVPTLLRDVERIWRCGRVTLVLAMRDAGRICASCKDKPSAMKMLFFCAWANEQEQPLLQSTADSIQQQAEAMAKAIEEEMETIHAMSQLKLEMEGRTGTDAVQHRHARIGTTVAGTQEQ